MSDPLIEALMCPRYKISELKRRALLDYRHPDALDEEEAEILYRHLEEEYAY